MLKHSQYTYFYTFSRATLNETFTAKYGGVLPLSRTQISLCFTWPWEIWVQD